MNTLIKYLFVILCIGLISCKKTPSPFPTPLLLADSLMYSRPDSALAVLESISSDIAKSPESVQKYYQLLTVKAQDKCFITHTSDSLMKEVVRYYESHGESMERGEAYYYLASVYRDMYNTPLSIEFFQKAIKSIKAINNNKSYKLQGLTYSQMGTLYFFHNLPEEGMDAYRNSYKYALLAKDSISLIHRLANMARVLTKMGNVDSTLHYYNSAINLADRMQRNNLKMDYELELSGIYLQLDSLSKVRSLLINNSTDDPRYYVDWGSLYSKSQKLDSAKYNLHKGIEKGDVYVKNKAYKILYQLEKGAGNASESLRYLEQAVLWKDSIQRRTDMEGVKRVEAMYKYQHFENRNNQLLLKVAQQKNALFISVFVIVLLVIAIVCLIVFERNRKKRIQEQKQRLLFFKEQQNNSIEINTETNPLEEQFKQLKLVNQQKMLDVFLSSELFLRFKQYPNTKIEEQDWILFQQEIDKVYDRFSSRLYILYPKLSQVEYRVCLLIKAGFSVTEISKLVYLASNSVSSMRKRLYEKIHNKSGSAKDLDEFIINF